MITVEEKRENFRRWWKEYIKSYPKDFILEHLDGIAETIFNSVLNCDIKISDVDPWHYTSKGEVPDKDGEYLCRYYKYGLRFTKVMSYRVKDNKWYHLDEYNEEEYRVPKPDAWQYIILPEVEV